MSLPRRVARLEQQSTELLQVQATAVPEPLPLEQPADVLALLSEQAHAVRLDRYADPLDKARTLGLLAGLALRAMEARDLAARLEAVERVLKLRQAAAPPKPYRRR